MRSNPIIGRNQGGNTRSLRSGRYSWIRSMPDWPHILCRADTQTPLFKKAAATTRYFQAIFHAPNTTLFVVTRPLVHNAMWILVPDRWIFIVKAGRASPYGRERACRLKSNIPALV